MARRDTELDAINRIMAILRQMSPVGRGRVLDYVVSRCESLGLPRPPGEQVVVEPEDMFAEVD